MGAAVLAGTMLASKAGWLGASADGATLLAFATAFFLAYRPLRELGDTRVAFARAQAAYDELVALIERARPPEGERMRDRFDSKERWPLGVLELRELSLARGKTGPISLRVEAGAIAVMANAEEVRFETRGGVLYVTNAEPDPAPVSVPVAASWGPRSPRRSC